MEYLALGGWGLSLLDSGRLINLRQFLACIFDSHTAANYYSLSDALPCDFSVYAPSLGDNRALL